ncbi:lytic murein transglycosylase [Desulfovibrio sp. OttesenSCG-928-O18]|nr:lytic murein transglycosylase [Desulfovibrio sp. OttesenSCG-928-O18]
MTEPTSAPVAAAPSKTASAPKTPSEQTPPPAAPRTAEDSPRQNASVPLSAPPSAPQAAREWQPLIARLKADGYEDARLQTMFAALNSPPRLEFMGQKAVELYGRFGKASLAISEEERAEFAPPDYSRIAGGMTVASGRRVIKNNARLFEGLYRQYGVPAPFIVAVMMVETGLGAETGRQSALLALGSMSLTRSLEQVLPVVNGITGNREEMDELIQARSDWAYNELKALIDYAQALNRDASTIPGSVYGAIGICQFMPSNIPTFAACTNKARKTPDLFILSDAAASVARYLSAHGWKKTQTPKAQIAVLRSYNHSDVYASTVYGVATALMSPTTHSSAQAARKGGNAVKAARESARSSIPTNSKKAKPVDELPNYDKLLE